MFKGRAAISYDHGYDAEVLGLGLALERITSRGSSKVLRCLERNGEDEPEDEDLFRELWKDEAKREAVLTILQAACEELSGRPEDYFPYQSRSTNRRSRNPARYGRTPPDSPG